MAADPKRRYFTPSETTAAWLIQDRRCNACRSEVERRFVEGDHMVPYDGTNTELDNLQALCSSCNRKKGNRSMEEMIASGWAIPTEWGNWSIKPGDGHLRLWQKRALDVASHWGTEILVEACPGAGKTRFAQEFAFRLLEKGEITRVLVIVPTVRVAQQWSWSSTRGERGCPTLPFAPPDWRPHLPLYEDWVGACATYATLVANATMMTALAAEPGHKTLVIFDEVHHAGTQSPWGVSGQEAFRAVSKQIMSLSGTPFRTKDPIVFVRVDSTGAAIPDLKHGYADALEHNDCRPIQFVLIGGTAEFKTPDGQQHEVGFDDELNQAGQSYRLRTALDPSGDFLPEMLRRADADLRRLRATDGDAAGLAIAMDCDHAEYIASMIESISGVRPGVACSRTEDPNDADALGVIEDFEDASAPWLVAVRMVSEGVDIPRLRVLAYATNVRAELSFRQIMGRIVRTDTSNEPEDFAIAYVPADPVLTEHVRRITNDAFTRLPKPIVVETDGATHRPITRIYVDGGTDRGSFKPLSSHAEVVVVTDTSGRDVPRDLYELAAAWIDLSGDDSISPFELAWLAMSDPDLAGQLAKGLGSQRPLSEPPLS